MLPAAAHAVDAQAVVFKLGRFGVQTVERFVVDCEQLGRFERGGRLKLDREARHLRYHLLISRNAGVLIAAALRVVHDGVKGKADFIVQTEKVQQRFAAVRQMAAKVRDARNKLLRLRQCLAPCIVSRKQIFDCPFILRRNVGTRRDLSGFHIDLPFRDG